MTSLTVQRGPGNKSVVAFAAVLTAHYLGHVNVVGAFFDDKNILVTNLAFKSNPVKPVGKYHGFYPCLVHALRLAVEDYIPPFRVNSPC